MALSHWPSSAGASMGQIGHIARRRGARHTNSPALQLPRPCGAPGDNGSSSGRRAEQVVPPRAYAGAP